MPVYEYACPSCGSVSDRLRKYEERERPIACSVCGAEARPVFSAAASPASHANAGPGCCGGGCGMS